MPETLFGTGQLYKRIYIADFIPGTPGTPDIPGSPPTPGYWRTEEQRYCVFYSGNPATALAQLSAITGSVVSLNETFFSGGRMCVVRSASVYVPPAGSAPPIPGIPAIPDQVTYDYQLGWNARARSIPTMRYDGTFSAVVPANTIGAMIGLTCQPTDRGYSDMTNAFYVRRGSVSIYEFGVEVQSLGSLPGAELAIKRYADKVRYLVNDAVVREVDATVLASMWMSGGLYSGGDAVDDSSYVEEVGGRIGGNMQRLRGYITDTDYAILDASLPALSGFISIPVESNLFGSLRAFTGYLGKPAALLFGEVQPLQGIVEGGFVVPSYGIIGGQLGQPVGTINVLSGQVMSVDASLQPLIGIFSDVATGYINGSLQPLAGAILGAEADTALMVSDAGMGGDIVAASELVAFINSSGVVTGLMSVQVLHAALMANTSTIGLTLTTQAQIEALMQSVARSIVGLLPPDQTGEAWVLNTDAGGMTRYDGYDFNSFAKVGDRYYGAKADGIYRLEGPDDAGTDIASKVNFGNLNFGSVERKALPYVYMGVASDGSLRLKVVAEETGSNGRPVRNTYYYTVRDNTELLKAHRFELGRGLRASYYDLEIQSVGGTAFDISEVEFFPVKLSRRL